MQFIWQLQQDSHIRVENFDVSLSFIVQFKILFNLKLKQVTHETSSCNFKLPINLPFNFLSWLRL